MTDHVPLIFIFFVFFLLLQNPLFGPAFDESTTVMALEGVQNKAERWDNCENSVASQDTIYTISVFSLLFKVIK